jgi:hypothetical protein
MEVVSSNDIKELIKRDNKAHVSIFMPTRSGGGMDPQGPIRLRNLLRVAAEKLENLGLRSTEAKIFVKPAESLLTNNLFWRQQSDGLALFIESNRYLYYRIPLNLREEVSADNRFHIKQLIPLLSNFGWIYVLVISQHEIRLLQCTATGSVRLILENIPRSREEALFLEIPDNRVRYHVSSAERGSNFGGATAIQSGEGSRPNYEKRNMMQYLYQVSNGVQNILKGETAPLVLAAVDYIHPMYRDANLYNNLLPEGIMGSPDGVSDEVLREQAWTIIRPYLENIQSEAVSDFQKSAGTGLTASDLTDVIPAAYHGRVRFLFLADDVQQWGRYSVDNNTVTIHSREDKENEDLLDLAAFQTLSHSGIIYAMHSEDVPGSPVASAILRF